ncbi:MAG: beta-galactosidase [Oscillospiraceae bacterium]|nr:beta-galactosidase [Oscillospiraceae bacterium]
MFQWQQYELGVCYYPEQWEESLWREDLRRMKDAGIGTVRVAEFCWVLFEPAEGEFHFDLFDRFLSLCQEEGMKVILGTPTATPPAWLTEAYPEVLNALPDKTLLRHGARRHYNYNSPVYQRFCSRIVEEMAKHFASHPAVIGWQIDNELNCETDEFHSEADDLAFREFLKKHYTTLEDLNRAWGTVVWSGVYTSWDQIFTPRPVLNAGHNPHYLLDYYRFISDSCISFAVMQAEILRKYLKKGDFITTNGLFGNVDNHALTEKALDVYTYDSYPDFALGLDRSPKTSTDLNDRKWSRNLIETRSVCPHFGIMEQQSGAGGWANRMEMPAPRPGQLTLWAMQSVAHGADFISFFRWRTAPYGTEIYWHGILDYDNRDNRKLREVKAFGNLLQKLTPVCGAEHVAAFALLKDYDNEWDAQADVWHKRISSGSEKEIFAASQLHHTPYDIVYLNDDTALSALSRYPVVFYPHPMIMTESRASLLTEYVKNGGTLVVGCRAGLKDANGKAVMMPQPGLLQPLTGTDVQDFTFVSPAEENDPAYPIFHDILTPMEGTAVLARYQTSYYAGEACLTEKKTGKGKTIHLGSAFSRDTVAKLFEHLVILEPFRNVVDAPKDVELLLREKGGKQYLFALNYLAQNQTLHLQKSVYSVFEEKELCGDVTLPPYGIAVYAL